MQADARTVQHDAPRRDQGVTTGYRRISSLTGAVGVILIFVVLFLPGPAPKTSDSVQHLTEVLIDKRRVFLCGAYVSGLGALALFWFLGAVRTFLRPTEEDAAAATTAVVGGASAVVLMLLGMTMSTGLALGAAGMHDDALVRALTDIGNILIEFSKFGFAALILGVVSAARHARLLPRRMLGIGTAAALILVLSAISPFVADTGLWQFGGGPEIAGGAPAALWLMWLSITMARDRPTPIELRASA